MPRGKARNVKVESRKAYRYVYSRDWDKLEAQVNEAIAEGYFPLGGISVTERYLYSQALMDREMVVALLAEAVVKGMPIPDESGSGEAEFSDKVEIEEKE